MVIHRQCTGSSEVWTKNPFTIFRKCFNNLVLPNITTLMIYINYIYQVKTNKQVKACVPASFILSSLQ